MQLTIHAAQVRPYDFPMMPPIVVGQAPMVRRHGLIVALRSGIFVGQGDYAPWPGFLDTPHDELSAGPTNKVLAEQFGHLARSVAQVHIDLEGCSPTMAPHDRAEAMLDAFAEKTVTLPQALRGALECALLDLLGQMWRQPMAALLSPAPAACVPVHKLVDSAWAAQNACQQGFVALKIKVGRRTLTDEMGTLCAIRSAVGPNIALRLDANGAWPQHIAVQALRLFHAASPAWMEQPVMDLAGLKALKALDIMPIAADESVRDASALMELLQADAVDGVVLKPGFVGGPRRAVQLGQMARAQHKRVCVTHAFDSAVGRAAALQVAMAFGAQEPCGLDAAGPVARAPEGMGLAVASPVLTVASPS